MKNHTVVEWARADLWRVSYRNQHVTKLFLLSGGLDTCFAYAQHYSTTERIYMNKFLERLNAGEVLVADGATGSNLQKMGLKPGRPPEDLIIDAPDVILKLASLFVEAGVQSRSRARRSPGRGFDGTGRRFDQTLWPTGSGGR